MSFLEKTAWAMSLILTAAGIFYFDKVISLSNAIERTAPPIIVFVIAYVVLVTIASAVIMAIIGASDAEAANAPADERERKAIDKAGHWSGYVLGFGAVAGLLQYSVTWDGHLLFHIVFASLMVSQIAEYLLQIFLLRRGA